MKGFKSVYFETVQPYQSFTIMKGECYSAVQEIQEMWHITFATGRNPE